MNELPVIDCAGCGLCCLSLGRPTYGSELNWWNPTDLALWIQMPLHLKQEILDHVEAFPDPTGTPCIWFDFRTRRCRHHEWRPQVCRNFEVAGEDCRSLRKDSAAGLTLPILRTPPPET